ncbi:MAG: DUF1800 family protein [Pirellulales bacterium]
MDRNPSWATRSRPAEASRTVIECRRFRARHPSTANLIAEKLCRRFLADEPTKAQIARVAETFRASDGDFAVVLHALFTSEEFRNRPGAKLKRPFDYVASALRMTYADTDGASVLGYLDEMGHRPYRWPLPDGYPDRIDRWEHGLLSALAIRALCFRGCDRGDDSSDSGIASSRR